MNRSLAWNLKNWWTHPLETIFLSSTKWYIVSSGYERNPLLWGCICSKMIDKIIVSMEEWNGTSKNAKNIINRNHPNTVRAWYFIPSGISPWSLFRNSILFGSISGWHQQTQRSGEVKKVIRCTWKRLSRPKLTKNSKTCWKLCWNAAEKLTFSCYDPTLILCSFPPTSFLLAFKKPMTFWLRTLSRFLINYCQVASQNVCLKIAGFVFYLSRRQGP